MMLELLFPFDFRLNNQFVWLFLLYLLCAVKFRVILLNYCFVLFPSCIWNDHGKWRNMFFRSPELSLHSCEWFCSFFIPLVFALMLLLFVHSTCIRVNAFVLCSFHLYSCERFCSAFHLHSCECFCSLFIPPVFMWMFLFFHKIV